MAQTIRSADSGGSLLSTSSGDSCAPFVCHGHAVMHFGIGIVDMRGWNEPSNYRSDHVRIPAIDPFQRTAAVGYVSRLKDLSPFKARSSIQLPLNFDSVANLLERAAVGHANPSEISIRHCFIPLLFQVAIQCLFTLNFRPVLGSRTGPNGPFQQPPRMTPRTRSIHLEWIWATQSRQMGRSFPLCSARLGMKHGDFHESGNIAR